MGLSAEIVLVVWVIVQNFLLCYSAEFFTKVQNHTKVMYSRRLCIIFKE
jgi:hypothetical protein